MKPAAGRPVPGKLSPAEAKRLKELARAYRTVFNSNAGKMVLEDLRVRCFYDSPAFAPGMDALTLAFRDGLRAAFLHMKHRTETNTDNLKTEE